MSKILSNLTEKTITKNFNNNNKNHTNSNLIQFANTDICTLITNIFASIVKTLSKLTNWFPASPFFRA